MAAFNPQVGETIQRKGLNGRYKYRLVGNVFWNGRDYKLGVAVHEDGSLSERVQELHPATMGYYEYA